MLLSPSLLLAACTDIPGTNIPVGAACFGASSYPTLTNPHDPINYGADNTGVNDSTAAINSAFSAGGDVQFATAGTYLVALSSGHGIVPPPNRILECAPGVAVTLIERSENCGNDCGILALQNGGNTAVGCDFQGGNSTAGPQRIGTNQGQFLIFISSNNNTVEGNTFENTWGNSAVQVNSDYTGILPANFMIQYNTFSHNAYYGPEVDLATSGAIQNNLQTDGAMGPENDGCNNFRSYVHNVTIQYNELVTSVGDCAVAGTEGCNSDAFITGGSYPPGCSYSTVTVSCNYCQGNAIQPAQMQNASPGGTGGAPAVYSNNLLGAQCSCQVNGCISPATGCSSDGLR